MRALMVTTALCAVFALPCAAIAQSQTVASRTAIAFNIRPQPLSQALVEFSRVTGVQLFFNADLVRGLNSPGARGSLTPSEALSRLLAGSGLIYQFTNPTTVTIAKSGSTSGGRVVGDIPAGAIPLDQINVQGNHSRDPGATEFTNSYTSDIASVGSKIPMSIRETPQSVSVITQQRIRDQNMTTMDDALRNAPGITLTNANSGYNFDSRGFPLTTITVDGVLENLASTQGSLDLAPYDRVEVLRGPAGLFTGAGNPGGNVNLARKRALDIFQVKTDATMGSWNSYRGELDVTGPLNDAKTVRGRFVTAGLDRDWFIDPFHDRKGLFYGTLEFDLTPATTLSVGAIYQKQISSYWTGLPSYPNGQLLDVPRSTSRDADWSRVDSEKTKLFAELEHRFENGGSAKISTRYSDSTANYRYAYGGSSTNLLAGPVTPILTDFTGKDVSVDGYVSTPFEFLGQKQNFLLGANYNYYRSGTINGSAPTVGQQNIFNPIHNFPYPSDDQYRLVVNQVASSENYGLYGQARLKAVDWATVIIGGRLSGYNANTFNYLTQKTATQYGVNDVFTPYAALVVDLNQYISAYGSYTSIFQPQSNTTFTGNLLPPIEGNQYEIGITGSFFDKRLNTRVAAFRTLRENSALSDPDHPGFSIADGLVRSQGVEVEASGRIASGWDVSASYAYTETLYLRAAATLEGLPFTTVKPKNLVKLWTKYAFEEGSLAGLSLGGGIRWQSEMYVLSGSTQVTQPAYSVVDLQVGYKVTRNIDASFSITNLFDANYYQTIANANSSQFFGEPRAYWLKVSSKW